MRTRPTKERAESRVASKYRKLYEPLVELIQSIEDLLPPGLQLDDTVELHNTNGELLITCKAHPFRLVVHDRKRTFVLEIRNPPVTANALRSSNK